MPEQLRIYKGESCLWLGVPLEQVIAEKPGFAVSWDDPGWGTMLFESPVMLISRCWKRRRMTCSSPLSRKLIKRRLEGFVCRLEVEHSMPQDLLDGLMRELQMNEDRVYTIDGLLNLKDLFFFWLPAPA